MDNDNNDSVSEMNMIEVLEKFGVPITMCIAFGFFIWKQNKWIQEDLKKDMEDNTERLENISIGDGALISAGTTVFEEIAPGEIYK